MISAAMNKALNEQIVIEFTAAYKYLAFSCIFDRQGLKNLSKRFVQQYEEELEHAMKILRYVQEVGGEVVLESIPKPQSVGDSVEAIVQAALDGELFVTKKIHELVALAQREKDYATDSFLQWFVDEQVEEVATMTDLLQLVKLAKGNLLQVETHVRHKMMEKED